MLGRRCVDLCCVQEVRWRGSSVRFLKDEEHRYKIFWVGNTDRIGSVGIFFAEKWVDKAIVVRVCDRILKFRLVLQQGLATIILACAPQGYLMNGKTDFMTPSRRPPRRRMMNHLFVAGGFNGHVGASIMCIVAMNMVHAMRKKSGCWSSVMQMIL
ncbi:uncharacterized protein LOC115215424 [Octopus sinensis]|uniref:Uncharacterized protein LOC115215424 n=1 Tax=Octopus sinensis TaxID=2607531 RepID=A0A6P7SQ93_9MOLL|nr:uncharacterized protein LOC115215424 [Octopus sinensis]